MIPILQSSAPLSGSYQFGFRTIFRTRRRFAQAFPCSPVMPSGGEQFKPQGPGHWNGFDQLDRHPVAQTKDFATPAADHGVASLVILEIVVANGAGRHEAVGAGLIE